MLNALKAQKLEVFSYELFVMFEEKKWKADREGDLRFKPEERFAKSKQDSWRDTPIYADAFETTILEDGVKKTVYALKYVMTYAYNQAMAVWCCPTDHYGDIENVTVYVEKKRDETPGRVLKVHYDGHGSGEGMWLRSRQLQLLNARGEKHPSNEPNFPVDIEDLKYLEEPEVRDKIDAADPEGGIHPLVYIAKNTHATYPRAKAWCRIFCFANDLTEEVLVHELWRPEVVKDIALFTQYSRLKFGWDGVTARKPYLLTKEEAGGGEFGSNQRSTTCLMRCCGILFSDCDCYDRVKNSKLMTREHELNHGSTIP